MAFVHTYQITDRLRTVASLEIGDGTTQSDVITHCVVIARCEDDERPELGVASTDPWVALDVDSCTADDFEELSEMTSLPARSIAFLEGWATDQRSMLENQLEGRVNAPKEIVSPWAA